MLRWIEHIENEEVKRKAEVGRIMEVIMNSMLRRFGHLVRKGGEEVINRSWYLSREEK